MIKVLVPDMPLAEELAPYLRAMDQSNIFVNGGPLVGELEEALSKIVEQPVAAVANGTLALELALRAMALPYGSAVLVPAMTFVATGQAVMNAGLVPMLCDVDLTNDWHMTPETAEERLKHHSRRISAVVPVASFGVPIDTTGWDRFAYVHGLPVVIDAAGALTTQQGLTAPNTAVAFSLHATKFIGAGEGGAVAALDRAIVTRVRELANFGSGGTNARMSEYHAAVALASLVRARSKREGAARLMLVYAKHLSSRFGRHKVTPRDATLLPVLMPEGTQAVNAQAALSMHGFESKQWYRPFLDERTQFLHCSRPFEMPCTETIRSRMLGLPFHKLVRDDHVERVCAVLERVIQ